MSPTLRRQGLAIVATLATTYVASHFFRAANVTIGRAKATYDPTDLFLANHPV